MTAVLTKLERTNCHKDLMSIFVEAFTDTSLKRVNDVDEVDIQTADNFLAKVHMEVCMDVIKNPHWLHDDMVTKSDLVQSLVGYPAETVLMDKRGQYWRRKAKVAVTRFHFLAPAGETQEQLYEQKYLLSVPLTQEDHVVS